MPLLDPDILALDAQHCLAVWRGLVVQCWNETHASAVDDNAARLRRHRAGDPGPIAVVVILEPGAPVPDAAARKALDALGVLLLDRSLCVAYVYQGTGFLAATMRAIMTTLAMITRHRLPTKICSTIPEALEFMRPMLRDEARFGAPSERARVISHVQDRFAARPR